MIHPLLRDMNFDKAFLFVAVIWVLSVVASFAFTGAVIYFLISLARSLG